MSDPVSCSVCAHFVPDPIGFGQGIGKCKLYEAYKALRPGPDALMAALRKLGNKDADGDLFWGGLAVDRQCEKYEPRTERL